MRLSSNRPRTPQRPGLTLIELIVVLMILVALAGVLIPLLPSMLSRAHNSTCPTNISECAKAVQEYQQLYNSYPNNWDALSDGTNMIDYFANGNALPASQGGPGTNPGNGEVTKITLTDPEVSALTGVGVNSVQLMVASALSPPAGFDPTFNYYSAATPTPVAITTSTVLAGMDPAAGGTGSATYQRCASMGLDLTGRYVILGIGPRCSMIGKTIQSSPVHFGDTPVLNPEYCYARFCAIFKVSTGNGTSGGANPNFTQAQLVGIAPIMDDGLGTIDSHLQSWYQSTNGGS